MNEVGSTLAQRVALYRFLAEHPLVRYYGSTSSVWGSPKAHRDVEGEHRAASRQVLLDHVFTRASRPAARHGQRRALPLAALP